MNELVQYVRVVSETGMIYALVACGFYFASIATRHFCFAAAASFVIVPYCTVAAPIGVGRALAGLAGLAACAILGGLYQKGSALVARRGAREGQLLICSLAALAITENVLTVLFGGASITIQSTLVPVWIYVAGLRIDQLQLIVVATEMGLLTAILVAWHVTQVGRLGRALVESRLNLSIRGLSVWRIEYCLASFGFVCVGGAGLLWASDGRVKPAMCTEVGVIGAVTFIVGTMLNRDVWGVILAGIMLALTKMILSLEFEGDWSMTSLLFLLLTAILIRGRQSGRSGTAP